MNSRSSQDSPPLPDDLGTELVDIMYLNTNLNYDACASNLIKIFRHLSDRMPAFSRVSESLVDSIQSSISNEEINPDLSKLEANLKLFHNLNGHLQSGEKNFYECNQQLLTALNDCIALLARKSVEDTFERVLVRNRQCILSSYEIWHLSSDVKMKCKFLQFYSVCFKSDPLLICLLIENTNIGTELCYFIRESITLKDYRSLIIAIKCLTTIVSNCRLMPPRLLEYLSEGDFIQTLFSTIESDESFLTRKINDFDDDDNDDGYNRSDYLLQLPRSHQLNQQQLNSRNQQFSEFNVVDLFVHLVLAYNKKFLMPEDNLLAKSLITSSNAQFNHKRLSEIILNMFNFEYDPLLNYQVKIDFNRLSMMSTFENAAADTHQASYDGQAPELYYINSVLKLISDLFSYDLNPKSTAIFYANDFNVLVDIIIRKLTNLGPNDQIRVDYLSLVQLMIKNSNYLDGCYRKSDLLGCFKSILSEKDADTIDQDIIRVILSETPQFK